MQSAVLILRELWRGRVFVALFALLALAAGFLIAYNPGFPPQTRKYEVGVSTVRILLDTPASQVVAIDDEGGGDLGGHASLLAQLMAEGEAKAAIAKRAGVAPDDLLTVTPVADGGEPKKPAGAGRDTEVLMMKTLLNDAGAQLPIIDVVAEAPDPQRAAKLASAAVTGLGDFLSSKAAAQQVPDRRRLEVRALSAAHGGLETRGPGLVPAIAVTIFTFGALCGLLLLVYALSRGWREAAAKEGRPPVPANGSGAWTPPPRRGPVVPVAPDIPEPVPSAGRRPREVKRSWSDPPE